MKEIASISNKKILIQTSNHSSPHLETEMEIIERLLDNNNEIFWIQCESDFQTCFYNPLHEKMHCKVCYSRVKNGNETINQHNKNIKNLHILKYKDLLSIDYYKNDKTLNSSSFKSVNDLKRFKFKNYDLGMATLSSLVSFTRNHIPDLVENSKFINNGLVTGAYLFDLFEKLLNQHKFDLVVLFNGRFIENRPLLRACQFNNIDFATHEKGGKLNTFLFRVNSIPHSITTINEEMEELWSNGQDDKNAIGTNFFNNKIQGIEDAWMSFTKEQQEGRLPKSFESNSKKKIITIFNSSLDEYEGLEGFGPYFYENDNLGISKIGADLIDFENIKVYLRIHPNLRGLQNAQMNYINDIISKIPSVEIINAEDKIDTYTLIKESDIIIVFGSTVGIEAAFLTKKVILLGRAAYEELNCVFIPKNHDEVIKAITDDNFEFPKNIKAEAIKFGYWNEKFGINYKYYQAVGFNKGTYRGKFVKANFLLRKVKQVYKFFKKIK